MPRFVVTSVIFYNKDLFAKLGMAAPTETWTWEREYVEAARQLTRDAGGEQAYGMDFPSEFRDTAVYAWGGEFFDKTGTKCLLDGARPIAGLEFAHDLRWKRRLLASPDAERAMNARTMFLNERIGMYQRGNFELGNLTAQKPAFQIGAALTPKGPAGRRQYGTLDFYGIAEGSKQKPAAWEFAKWPVGDEGQQHLVNTETITPATQKAYQSPDVAPEIWRVFTEATKTAVFLPPVRNSTEVSAAISRELGTALNDNARGVPDAARAAATAAAQLMAR